MISAVEHAFQKYSVAPITSGWSEDNKYLLCDKGEKYILRVSSVKSLEAQQAEFEAVSAVPFHERIIRPVSFGKITEADTFILYTYLEGEDLRPKLQAFSKIQQYDLGLQAGSLLSHIHSGERQGNDDFGERYAEKIRKKIESYRSCGIAAEGLDRHIPYLEENLGLLNDRNVVLQHGDFHIGNMVIDAGQVGIIDFNRYGFGDPYEEFDRMSMNRAFSQEFAGGLLHGYFKGVPPVKFWSILKLYSLTNAVGSIPWALACSPESLDFVKEMIDITVKDYSDLKAPQPLWYEEMLNI